VRIALISDVHVEYAGNRTASSELAARLARQRPDVLVVAGDVGSTPSSIEEGLAQFVDVAAVRTYLPGNHDLWVRLSPHDPRAGADSWDAYDRTLPEIAQAAGFSYLPAAPLVIGDVGLAGETGWFDYTFRPKLPALRDLPIAAFEAAEYEGWTWPDFQFCDWGMDMPSVTEIMLRRIGTKLTKLDADPAVRKVVAITHHVPFRNLVTTWSPELEIPEAVWDYCSVFMGSEELGRRIVNSDKVVLALHGHSHVPGEWQVARHDGAPIRIVRSPFGTETERARRPEGRGVVIEV
jgi:3',5'-cyclic AMP phosphodiesterase CpdA